MSADTTKFRLFKKEKDDSFNVDRLDQYELLLQFGESDFQIAVIDAADNRVLLVEDYIIPGATGSKERLDYYNQIFNDHHFLLANFWNDVIISFKRRKFSLIPDHLFDENNLRIYLDINAGFDDQTDSITVIPLKNFELKIDFKF